MKIFVRKLYPDVQLPEYQTEHSVALDVVAYIAKPQVIKSMERAMIPTGFAVAIPEGYEIQIRARSGLALKHGITMINGVGTIDSDYRGEIGVLVVNLGTESFTVEPGMRIAQMVVARCEKVQWEETDELDETARGAGGFGSTGR